MPFEFMFSFPIIRCIQSFCLAYVISDRLSNKVDTLSTKASVITQQLIVTDKFVQSESTVTVNCRKN